MFAKLLLISSLPILTAGGASAPPPESPVPPTSPRVEVQTLSMAAMYRVMENEAGVTTANQLLAKVLGRATLRLDPDGRVRVTAGGGTGSAFQGSWNLTGIGTGEPVRTMCLKHLFVTITPSSRVEVHAGGLDPARGESTEITTYDNDGYMVGGRVAARQVTWLRGADLTVTAGHLGAAPPNVFRRFERLSEANYAQALAVWRWKPASVAADLTRLDGRSIARGAVVVRTSRILTSARLETYRDVDADESGFAVAGDRKLRYLRVGGGLAVVGSLGAKLNADRFPAGRRIFVDVAIPVVAGVSVSIFGAHLIEDAPPSVTRTRIDVIAAYNVLSLIPNRR